MGRGGHQGLVGRSQLHIELAAVALQARQAALGGEVEDLAAAARHEGTERRLEGAERLEDARRSGRKLGLRADER